MLEFLESGLTLALLYSPGGLSSADDPEAGLELPATTGLGAAELETFAALARAWRARLWDSVAAAQAL